MKQLAKAVELAARANEADNPVYANSRAIAERLIKQGVPEKAAQRAAETRIFSNESGRYGTGLDDAALATDTWKSKGEADKKLAGLYLSRMQHAYGSDESAWGTKGIAGADEAGAKVNLYAEHLKGTEGAVLSRTSNLYGMLTTDDPFQYLGGIGAAVRALDGKAPELYISNLRNSGADGKGGRIEGADQFLAKELATRNFHPGYIQGLMAEGYAGTLQVLDGINNFTGWTTSRVKSCEMTSGRNSSMSTFATSTSSASRTGSRRTTRTRWPRASRKCSKWPATATGRPTPRQSPS